MPDLLPKAAKAELRLALAKCNQCRSMYEALQEAGLDVSEELARTDKSQQVAERLLQLQQEQQAAK